MLLLTYFAVVLTIKNWPVHEEVAEVLDTLYSDWDTVVLPVTDVKGNEWVHPKNWENVLINAVVGVRRCFLFFGLYLTFDFVRSFASSTFTPIRNRVPTPSC